MKKRLIAYALLLASIVGLAGALPAEAVASKYTLTRTCTASPTTAFNVKLHLNGNSAGYRPDQMVVSWNKGVTTAYPITEYTIYWLNSSGVPQKVITYGTPALSVSQTQSVVQSFNPADYPAITNYLWQVTLRNTALSICTTIKST